jgi:hypothetical protein
MGTFKKKIRILANLDSHELSYIINTKVKDGRILENVKYSIIK